jgi:MoaA/NifB/PqqE/SkfB family radical SAM enzyme
MFAQSVYHTFKRYRTLQTHKISALPIVILMPHSACNCQCVMCDIWKGNKNLKQLTEQDVEGLMNALHVFGTRQVVMSGGEALLNANFFRLCEILKKESIRITLLSTGLTIKRNAGELLDWVDDIIVSLDGDEGLHDQIRNIPGAYNKLREGVQYLKAIKPGLRITGRTVIHRLNFRKWADIIDTAKNTWLDQVSFLPADISSTAFNRQTPWDKERQDDMLPSKNELYELQAVIDKITRTHRHFFEDGFIAESPGKLQKIHDHYSAFHGMNDFPYKKCNAPWVSAVIEADGSVKPCFFHDAIGNIRDNKLDKILNSEKAYRFRKELDIQKNSTCIKCVCYLNLPPTAGIR